MMDGGTSSAQIDPSAVLNRLDWQLSEIGRRQHRFAWLRGADGDWLAVDSYYPGSRVVVIVSDDVALLDSCARLVPEHGLFLLAPAPAELSADSAALARQLRLGLEQQGWAPRTVAAEGNGDGGPARAAATVPVAGPGGAGAGAGGGVAASAARVAPDEEFDVPAGVRLRRAARGGAVRAAGGRAAGPEAIGVGFTLVIAVVLELVVGGVIVGLGAGDYVLGVGFLLDACARVLGMVLAAHNDDLDAAWTAVLFGSPALWGLSDAAPSVAAGFGSAGGGAGRGTGWAGAPRSPERRDDLVPLTRATATAAGTVLVLGLFLGIV